jgi:uncharacterized protein
MATTGTVLRRGLGLGAAAAAAGLAYGWWEARWFTVREATVPVLPAGAPDLRVLHLSDLHLAPYQHRKRAFLASLAALEPDLVINTGDNLGHQESIEPLFEALGSLTSRPGAFVLGSNDYFSPVPKNPVRYLLPDTGHRVHGERLPWGDLRNAFTDAGWLDLTHERTRLQLRGLTVELAGVSDAHHDAAHYERIEGAVAGDVDVAIGLSHTPEPDLIDAFAADGFRLVLCGHTHGGQLRVPWLGALVTNCGLDRRRARGLWRWTGRTWLHVSAGLGTSPYAPVRFSCHPEATLLTLVAAAG